MFHKNILFDPEFSLNMNIFLKATAAKHWVQNAVRLYVLMLPKMLIIIIQVQRVQITGLMQIQTTTPFCILLSHTLHRVWVENQRIMGSKCVNRRASVRRSVPKVKWKTHLLNE